MSSTDVSETDTLLPSSIEGMADEHDRPVQLEAFKRNLRWCKSLLAIGLPAVFGLEIAALVLGARVEGADWGKRERTVLVWEKAVGVVGCVATGIALVFYLTTLLNIRFHRSFCTTAFLLFFLTLIVHPLPGIIYTAIYHLSPPSILVPAPYALTPLSITRTVLVVFNLLVVGSMRRGPRLHYEPMRLRTGFGVNAGKETLGKKDEPNVLDWDNCSMLDFIFLFYISGLAVRSTKVAKLGMSDLPHLEEKIRKYGEERALPEGQIRLGVTPHITPWSLVRAVWKGRGSTVFLSLILEVIKTAFSYLQVVAQHEIIQSFSQPQGSDKSYAYLMCWGLFFGQAVEVLLGAYLNVRENYLLHLPVRMTLASMLFSKILRSTDAKAMEAQHVSGDQEVSNAGRAQVMNLLTIDSGTIASLATKSWALSNSIISLAIGLAFLWSMLGVSAFVGIACIPLSTPASVWVAKKIYRCDKTWAACRDARTSAIKEFLLGIKVIKLNAFESTFQRNIERLRDVEVIWQRWRYTLGTLFNILADQLPVIAILVTFTFHTKVMHRPLDPATAFVALTVFNRVKDSLSALPDTFNAILVAKVALDRLCNYLNQPEIEGTAWDISDGAIICKNATIGWPMAETDPNTMIQSFKLRNLDFTLPQGKFTLICGPLGSGKTLFLRALLGEARVEEGSVQAPRSLPDATPLDGAAQEDAWTLETWLDDSVAYSPQQAYIRHGTLRDNVLFGQPLWRDRYREALRQASLLPDIGLLQDGDLTEVGDNGVNLSGGQKARVNLARCIYSRARTVYLDDVLSAVDAHTSHFIFKECFQGGLLAGRTVVLVTHHVSLCLPGADFVVSLRGERVDQACPASEVKRTILAAMPEIEPQEEEQPVSAKIDNYRDEQVTTRQVYKDEHSGTGRVQLSHYWLIFTSAGGLSYWLVLALIFGGTRAVDIIRSLWLKKWSSDPDPSDLDSNLIIYAALVSVNVLFGAFRWVWLYGMGNVGFYNRGSRKVHKTVLDKICAAPLSFFEGTPAGRLMNIFGQDTFRIDAFAADDFGRTVMAALDVGTAAIIVCTQAPVLLIMMAVFGGPLWWLSGILGKLRADIRRLTALAGSPLITLYHDAIDGVVMIRAFGSSELMAASMSVLVNRERQTSLADWTVYNWVRGLIRSITSVVVTATGFILVGQNISPALAGFILSYAIQVSQGLFGLLECYSNLEQTFVSAERLNHCESPMLRILTSDVEMPLTESTKGSVPPKDWPSKGAIQFENLSVKYADDLPEVLKDVSFTVEPGMRVGLVGSTGSGKSTLALTLFRAIEACRGRIVIDGLDIKDVKLKELRRRLNMVVQDGTLCSGSLRDALDITGTKDDHEVYEALRRVHLIPETIEPNDLQDNPFANLDTYVAVEGANFSQGQRQLLCLARALLKTSKILVMDEATSSVDFEMDAKITATIKECFTHVTMIVIAHRLATIMHYDRVLVLNKGRVLEYGKPVDLVADTTSAFHALCMAQGEEEYNKLLAMVQK
ncbi:P-loop containing nucleoside triphosphate hydrolase protein [Naematelia encephala]|uniref:p-loop containing nucleoside triphosphate hydrolase protein n=1 Tax=Naematelia encephala TaxID=71784 RepID=A0A1Y2AVP6_9TREE|nr:P-loop containing nucleoside triphosphate hydrolase protein [Naematelia encephala]